MSRRHHGLVNTPGVVLGLSNTLGAGFYVDALRDALARYGKSAIFNTDQCSQVTSADFTDVLKDAGVAISMDGQGRCIDNIFIGLLWRSLKYEAVYLHELTDRFVAERMTGDWLTFYNEVHPHLSLRSETLAESYTSACPVDKGTTGHARLTTSPQAQQQLQDSIDMKNYLAT